MNVTDFRQLITPHAPGVPVSIVDNLVRQVLVEFFTKSEAWQVTLDPIFAIQKLAFYDFPVSDGAKVIRVLQASYADTQMVATDEITIRQALTKAQSGTPAMYGVTAAGELIVAPTPSKLGDNIYVKAVLVPTGVFTTIDNYAVEEHQQAIIDGVLSKIFAMPKGWNDPKASLYHKQLYMSAMQLALRTNNKEAVNRTKVVKYGGL